MNASGISICIVLDFKVKETVGGGGGAAFRSLL